MPDGLTYQAAKAVLTPAEFERLACLFFHIDSSGKIDYDAAAKDFGSATPGSMRVMMYAALRKVRAVGEAPENGASPKKKRAGKKAGGREMETGKGRKKGASGDDGGNDDDEEDAKAGAAKTRGKKRKVAENTNEKPADWDEEFTVIVKNERSN